MSSKEIAEALRGHGPRLCVCQAPNASICVSDVARPKHQMRLYVCHQMRLHVCHLLRSLTFARFARTCFDSLNWLECSCLNIDSCLNTNSWTPNGPPNGPKMDPTWSQNGPEMDPKWTKNGPT